MISSTTKSNTSANGNIERATEIIAQCYCKHHTIIQAQADAKLIAQALADAGLISTDLTSYLPETRSAYNELERAVGDLMNLVKVLPTVAETLKDISMDHANRRAYIETLEARLVELLRPLPNPILQVSE